MAVFSFCAIRRQSAVVLAAFVLAGMSITGCDFVRTHTTPDREASADIQDFRDMLAPRDPESQENDRKAGIPELQPYIASPDMKQSTMPLVSISVNQTVPLKDVLFELAKQANYDIQLDPRITGSIIFTARSKPLDEVVDRISDIAGLRYRFIDGDTLRIELDTPYNKTYQVDYLAYIRENKSSVRNSVNVVSGDGADTGSQFEVSSTSGTDFWAELQAGLMQVLASSNQGIMRTGSDPQISVTDQNPSVRPVAPKSQDGQVQVQPPDVQLNIGSLPVSGGGSGAGNQAVATAAGTFSINKQAGILNVFTTERTHKEVEDYLNRLRQSVASQVLIEAKILEVILTDEFATGINWRLLNLPGGEFAFNFLDAAGDGFLDNLRNPATAQQLTAGTLLNDPNSTAGVVLGYAGNDAEALIQALSRFGTVRALASPRLTVLNNQSAVLNVATNRVFFELDIQRTEGSVGGDVLPTTEINTQIRNVPEGVLLNVLPSINMGERTISMALRPTITRVVRELPDPGVQFVVASSADPLEGIESLIPELNVQEIDSVIKVKSGQPIVMGGLLQDRVNTNLTGVPGLSELPMIGGLFRNSSNTIRKTELVIFLQATILNSPGDSVSNTDRDIYRRFSSDRRPFRL